MTAPTSRKNLFTANLVLDQARYPLFGGGAITVELAVVSVAGESSLDVLNKLYTHVAVLIQQYEAEETNKKIVEAKEAAKGKLASA